MIAEKMKKQKNRFQSLCPTELGCHLSLPRMGPCESFKTFCHSCGGRNPTLDAEARRRIEHLAMRAVMEYEQSLGWKLFNYPNHVTLHRVFSSSKKQVGIVIFTIRPWKVPSGRYFR